MKLSKNIIIFSFLLILIIIIFQLSQILNPEKVVNSIGIENGYFLAFIASFFGGFSAITSITHLSVLATLIAGGLNPILLGIVAGISLALGDLILFYFGTKGRELIKGKLDKRIKKVSSYIFEKKLEKYIPIFSYIYISFLPLPNDWLLLFLASIQYPFKKTQIIIISGDITHALFITTLFYFGFNLI